MEDYEELKLRLEEAEDTLRAIRSGEVDAVVVSGDTNDQVFTLKDATHPYRVMVEAMNEGAVTLTTKGIILYCNARFAEMLQTPMGSLLGEPISRFIIKADRRKLNHLLTGKNESGRTELILQSPAQETEVSISIRAMELDGAIRFVGLFSDLKDLHRAEAQIRRLAEEYRSLLATSTDGYWLFDQAGKILDVNEAYCRMSGYTRKDLLGKTVEALEPTGKAEKLAGHMKKILKAGSDRFESQHIKKNGRVMDVDLSVTFLKSTSQLILFVHDITDVKIRLQELENYRHHLEELVAQRAAQLEESEKRYRELFKYAPTAIYEIDFLTNKFTSVNDAMCETLGYTREELLNKDASEVLDPESRESFKERMKKWMAGEEPDPNVEYCVLTKDGRKIYTLLRTRFTRSANGTQLGATVIATDISERKHMEDEMRAVVKKLQATNAELKWLNESMVNRELRMIDLKKEVNELCERANLPKRYP